MRDNVATICDTQNEHTKITQQFVCENVSLVYWRDSGKERVASQRFSYKWKKRQAIYNYRFTQNVALLRRKWNENKSFLDGQSCFLVKS
jgi:hypothetical protein